MRKVAVGIGVLMVGGLSAFAGEFPYVQTLTERYHTNETTLASYAPVDVPKVDGGMQTGENVAVITMNSAVMTALDEDGWTECTNALTDIQAAFTLKSVSDDIDACEWMGYTGGAWQKFTGVTAAAGTYTVKIEIDYSLTAPKVRYTVNSTVMHLTPDDDGWVDLGKLAEKVENVQLCGYGTTGEVKGEAAARPAEGTVTVVEDVSSNYKSIRLGVVSADTWGVSKVNVVVKDSTGKQVGDALVQDISTGGTNYVDLASYVKPGETYTYEVKLTDATSSRTTEPHVSQPVNLFSSDAWFQFTGTAFTNATSAGITIANNKFFATDEEVEGLVTPDNAPKANLGTVVTTEIEVSNVCTELTNFTANIPQFAVALGGSNQSRVWKYCECGTWTDGPAGLPTENGTYVGRATFDYATQKVKYEIQKKGDPDSEFYVLVAAADLAGEDTRLNKVGILGGGNVSGLVAVLKLAEPPPVSDDDITPPGTGTDGKIKLHNNTEVGLDKLNKGSYVMENDPGKNCHLKWKDADNKMGKIVDGKLTVLDANIQNGVSSSYDSYVLGLDAEVATDRPAAIVKPGASQMVDNKPVVPVYVPNLKQTKAVELGYTIKLVLEQKKGAAWEPVEGGTQEINPTTGETVSGNDIKIPLDGGVYRVNTVIE